MRRCTSCGGPVSDDARFCGACGFDLRPRPSAPSRRGRGAAWLLLGLALGVGGAAALWPGPDGQPRWRRWVGAAAPGADAGVASSESQPDARVDEVPALPEERAEPGGVARSGVDRSSVDLGAVDLGAVDLGGGVRLVRAPAPPELASRLVTALHAARGRVRGSRRLEIAFDPAVLAGEPVVYQVVDRRVLVPVAAEIGEGRARFEADVWYRPPPGASTVFRQGGGTATARTPSIEYAVGRRSAAQRCREGRAGEADLPAGSPVALSFDVDASCALGERVRALVEEGLDHYAEAFPDAGGSPLRRYRPDARLFVYLERNTRGVNGSYQITSPRGHMVVDVNAAESNPEGLRETVYHELFHAVQDHYATMIATGVLGSHWWFEGSAEWAGLRARGVAYAEAVRTELGRYPALLSVPMDETGSHGDMDYGVALYVYAAEGGRPGFVAETLAAPDVVTSGHFAGATRQAAGFPDTYASFLAETVRVAPAAPWSDARFIVGERGVRVARASAFAGQHGALREHGWEEEEGELRYADRVRVELPPMTARFAHLAVRDGERTRVEATVTRDGVPRGHGFFVTEAGASGAEGGVVRVDPVRRGMFVVYNPHDAAATYALELRFVREPEEEPAPEPPPRPVARQAPGRSFTGHWRFAYGCMALRQRGESVTGEVHGHRHGASGTAQGRIVGTTLTLEFDMGPNLSGRAQIDTRWGGGFGGPVDYEGVRDGRIRLRPLEGRCRAADAPPTQSCYASCLEHCSTIFACAVEGERVSPEVYCDGLQGVRHEVERGPFHFIQCGPHLPRGWRARREQAAPGARSLVPRVNPGGRAN